MINTSGIVYRIISIGCPVLLIGIICLITSKFWIPNKRKISSLIISICILLFAISYIIVFTYKSIAPSTITCEGIFIREYTNSSQAPFTRSYIFDVGSPQNKRVFLDSFSKKKIYPYDFQKGGIYKITFEEDTGIILQIVKTGDGSLS